MSKLTHLNYSEAGSGIPLVLLHGFCENKNIWRAFSDKLSESFRVVTPDLPGFGESPAEGHDKSIELMAEKVHALLQHLNIKKCVLIGHSLGGYVALAFAEKHEDMLLGLGLFHSTAFADTKEKKESRQKAMEFITRHGMPAFAESFVEPLFFVKNRAALKEEIRMMTEIAKATSAETTVNVTAAMRDRKDRTGVLKKIGVPVLFIVGKEDQAVPLEKSLEQCLLPRHSVVHFLSDTGHMGMFEKKEETVSIVRCFAELFSKI